MPRNEKGVLGMGHSTYTFEAQLIQTHHQSTVDSGSMCKQNMFVECEALKTVKSDLNWALRGRPMSDRFQKARFPRSAGASAAAEPDINRVRDPACSFMRLSGLLFYPFVYTL